MPAEPAAERISRAVVVLVAGTSAVVLIVGLRYWPVFLALVLCHPPAASRHNPRPSSRMAGARQRSEDGAGGRAAAQQRAVLTTTTHPL